MYQIFPQYPDVLAVERNDPLAHGLVFRTCDDPNLAGGKFWYDDSPYGYSNNGTPTGGPIFVPGRDGGPSLKFDGTDDGVDILPTTVPIPLRITGEITIAAWMKDDNASGIHTIISHYAGGNHWQYGLQFNRTADKLNLAWGDGTSVTINDSTSTITDTSWHHVVGVRSGTNGDWTATLYIDGVNAGATSGITINPTSTNNYLSIGYLLNFNLQYFQGQLADICVYNRAISAAEVAELYYRGRTRRREVWAGCPVFPSVGVASTILPWTRTPLLGPILAQ